jgi:hypothetical protein
VHTVGRVVFPNEVHITNLHMFKGLHYLIQLPIENFSLLTHEKKMQVELSRHTHHVDICTSSVFRKPS